MHIRIIYLSFIVFISTICQGQKESGKLYFKEIGWTITLPEGYNVLDSTVEAATLSRGKKAIEESNNLQFDVSDLKTLVSASKSQFNYFSSTITPFDALEDGDYQENNQEAKDIMFVTFTDQIPNAKIDSLSTSTIIDGLSFDKFQLKILLVNDITMTMIMLNRIHKNYDFGITYLYLDETTRGEIENMLFTSKFEK